MDEVRDYELSLHSTSNVNGAQVNSSTTDENRVLTFAELKELIESGNVDKIPNNKIIPETLNVCFFCWNLVRVVYLFNIRRMHLQVDQQLPQKRNLGR